MSFAESSPRAMCQRFGRAVDPSKLTAELVWRYDQIATAIWLAAEQSPEGYADHLFDWYYMLQAFMVGWQGEPIEPKLTVVEGE